MRDPLYHVTLNVRESDGMVVEWRFSTHVGPDTQDALDAVDLALETAAGDPDKTVVGLEGVAYEEPDR